MAARDARGERSTQCCPVCPEWPTVYVRHVFRPAPPGRARPWTSSSTPRWRALHADACRGHALVGWVVRRNPPEYPGKVVARLVTETPTPYVLVAEPWPSSTPGCRRAWRAPGASR